MLAHIKPMVERMGVFALKCLTKFQDSKAQIAITNFTKKSVLLAKGTIVANLESFEVVQLNVHNDLYDEECVILSDSDDSSVLPCKDQKSVGLSQIKA